LIILDGKYDLFFLSELAGWARHIGGRVVQRGRCGVVGLG